MTGQKCEYQSVNQVYLFENIAYYYLRQRDYVMPDVCQFVHMSVCLQLHVKAILREFAAPRLRNLFH